MGEHFVTGLDPARTAVFTKSLLTDLLALEKMLENGQIESGIRRIGAEQEMFIIDRYAKPAPFSKQILQRLQNPKLTTELARFNLEANAAPQILSQNCFSILENELTTLWNQARSAAAEYDADILLTGILPTLELTDLTLSNLTDEPRYHQLNLVLTALRAGEFYVHIKGLDEIHITHQNMMMEACNTSFQVHFQADPFRFADQYNIAQAITGPVLAAAVNSPLLFGKRLWAETRLALFQHSVDERTPLLHSRFRQARVNFGDNWLKKSVLETFREDIATFRSLLTCDQESDPFELLSRGEIPLLTALRLHNGTVWRWNRPCYGITDGQPHLRIENRVLPSGPTITDEVANAAFFTGLMVALPEEYGAISSIMDFNSAKNNFHAAARHGLNAQFKWLHGTEWSAPELILQHLVPLAHQGLHAAGVDSAESDQYLGIIEERVKSRQTGAEWIMKYYTKLENSGRTPTRCRLLTERLLELQESGQPVHIWPSTDAVSHQDQKQYRIVAEIMSTSLFTVRPYDLVNLAASIMDWEQIRHIPVEDDDGRLAGLISHRDLLKLIAHSSSLSATSTVPVHMIMKQNVITVSPETSILEAVRIMREQKIGCLPVVTQGRLTGIITVYDLLSLSASLLEEKLLSQ